MYSDSDVILRDEEAYYNKTFITCNEEGMIVMKQMFNILLY